MKVVKKRKIPSHIQVVWIFSVCMFVGAVIGLIISIVLYHKNKNNKVKVGRASKAEQYEMLVIMFSVWVLAFLILLWQTLKY
jgi:NADH:ubiquinone oxidoreductase subunit 6 (subunit J)